MAREPSSPPAKLSEGLAQNISRINFYRFCRLIEQLHPERPPLGSGSHPADDAVRLLPHPGMGFPAGELRALEVDADHPDAPPVLRTAFLGLYGVDSPLPASYVDDIAQRSEGHEALQGMLDIFNHRILTQFYRIWRKYAYPATFEAGGRDATSQSLLGLIGLGIPGTDGHIATPVSRFLALLGVLRQPGRTAEGVRALVRLLAPATRVSVQPHCLRPLAVSRPLGFQHGGFVLDGNTPLGEEAQDASSQLLIVLHTGCINEARGWLPDGALHRDFKAMLRVYLGWRYTARLRLTLPTPLLAVPPLGEGPLWLGMTGVLGAEQQPPDPALPAEFTTDIGRYAGMDSATPSQGNRRVNYHFI